MRKIKVSEAAGEVLDWLVAKCLGLIVGPKEGQDARLYASWEKYSTDWVHGGPIIELEGIWLRGPHDATKPDGTVVLKIDRWYAHKNHSHTQNGPTPLIAAMRCYVASKLGDEVEVPDGL